MSVSTFVSGFRKYFFHDLFQTAEFAIFTSFFSILSASVISSKWQQHSESDKFIDSLLHSIPVNLAIISSAFVSHMVPAISNICKEYDQRSKNCLVPLEQQKRRLEIMKLSIDTMFETAIACGFVWAITDLIQNTTTSLAENPWVFTGIISLLCLKLIIDQCISGRNKFATLLIPILIPAIYAIASNLGLKFTEDYINGETDIGSLAKFYSVLATSLVASFGLFLNGVITLFTLPTHTLETSNQQMYQPLKDTDEKEGEDEEASADKKKSCFGFFLNFLAPASCCHKSQQPA